MTRALRSESELTTLRKRALELASLRKERPTTVHLLAAIAGRPGPAQDLLATRNLDEESLLKAGRSFDEAVADPIALTLTQAREVAKRARGPVSTDDATRGEPNISPDSKIVHLEPNALHLLVALLSERQLAAHRALSLTGIDTTRLRTAALSLALGVVPPRRPLGSLAAMAPGARRPAPMPAAPSMGSTPPRPSSLGAPRVVPLSLQPSFGKRPSTPPPAPRAPSPPPPSNAGKAGARPVTASPSAKPAGVTRGVPRPAVPAAPTPTDDASSAASTTERRPETLRSLRATPLEAREIVGRELEIERAVDTLMKHTENAVVLVGASGVGKTAILRALAGPLEGRGRVLVAIEPGTFLASAPRGALADRLAQVFDELRSSGDRTVLFIDDLHDLLAASDDLVTELKTQLARADVGFVSGTTPDQYRKHVETDPQLARRLSPIHVEEPEEDDAFLMVESASAPIAKHHAVAFSPEAIAAAVSLTIRYMPGRALPEKALSTLDLAASRSKRGTAKGEAPVLDEEDVAQALALEVDVPVSRMLQRDAERMLALESLLGERVVGHDQAIATIAGHLRKSAAGLRGARPLGSFLLLGPTGVGKTETAKAVAEVLFGSSDAMTRIDLSEYGEAHSVARLLGAPPGYVGHEAGGQLTEAVRRRAYQVVLLDEIEKAHTDVLLAFLQVLDEGHLTDGRGRRVDFKNTIVFATSNLGSRDVAEALGGRAVGFSARARSTGSLSDKAIATAKKGLPIELFNRFDEVLFFAPLEREEVRGVARRLLADLGRMLRDKDMRLDVDDRAIDVLLEAGGYQPELGARPMRRAIARLVEAPIAEMLIKGVLRPGMAALVGEEDGEICVDAVQRTDPSAVPPRVELRA